MKKFRSIIIILAFLIIATINPVNADASTYNKACITLTPKLTEATFEYVNEIYTKKYPEMGLRFLYGTEQDRNELKTLADKITKGKTTDKSKLDAIINWTRANLDYQVDASAYPMETFYTRKGNCMSYSLFVSQLARLEGIPSVVIDGWVGDMKTLTQKVLYEEMSFDGHAWIYAYINNKWIMYDPLWYGTMQLTDMDFVNKNYYSATVEGINMTYKGMDLDYAADGAGPYYDWATGKFMFYREDGMAIGNSNNYVNGISLPVTMYDQEGCGYEYVNDRDATDSMVIGEVFSGERWIKYGDAPSYCYGNGVHPSATVIEYNGDKLYMGDGGDTYKLLTDDFWIESGYPAVKTGFEGYVMESPFLSDVVGDPEFKITYKLNKDSSENNCVKVSEDGYIQAIKEGYAWIEYELIRVEDNAYISAGGFGLIVASGRRTPDYTSRRINIKDLIVSIPQEAYSYTGKSIKPKVTVTENISVNGFFPTLVKDQDYTVKYSNNKAIGKATITVKGKGNYKGTVKINFEIGPKGTSIKTLSGKSKGIKLTWKKISKKYSGSRISGYEVAYSRSKSFDSYTYKSVIGYRKTSMTITRLKAKKRYYVRVRTFIEKNGKIYHSSWSKARSVKTK